VSGWRLLDLGDGTHWADPEDERACNLEWRLRHLPAAVTRNDMLLAATLIDNYRELTRRMGTRAAQVVARMRHARLAAAARQAFAENASPKGDPEGSP
jgi:hypothetical protein